MSHSRWLGTGGCVALLALPAPAQQPVINPNGVVNAASYVRSPQDSHALAPSSIAAIFGKNLAAGTQQAGVTPLPVTLAGTSVTINGIPAPLFYVSPTQINLEVPAGIAQTITTGYFPVPVVVTTAAGTSPPAMVDTLDTGPGIFTLNGGGCGQGAVINVKPDGTVSLNGPSNSASPGDYLEIFATGFGVPKIPIPDGSPAPAGTSEFLASSGSATLAGMGLDKFLQGKAPGLVGVDQVNVRIPTGAPEGCSVPLTVQATPLSSQPVLVSVHTGGGQCVDSPLATLGQVTLSKAVTASANSPSGADTFSASLAGSPFQMFPVPPTSLAGGSGGYAILNDQPTFTVPACPLPGFVTLDGGTITLQGPGGTLVSVQPALSGGSIVYKASLAAGTVETGVFIISAEGGENVGPFQASLAVGAPIQLTTQFPPGTAIDITKPLTVGWQGGDPSSIVTVRLIVHNFLYDNVLESQVPASDGTVTFDPVLGENGQSTLPLLGGGPLEIIVDVGPNPMFPLTFASPGLTLGGLLNWNYEYDFPGPF